MSPGPIAAAELANVRGHLGQRLSGPVGLDLWSREESQLIRTDRDRCKHCPDVVELGRQLASLHPALRATVYDWERHASRAAEAGLTMPPTTVLRGGGRAIRLVGLFSGLLFPPLLDVITFLSQKQTPLTAESKAALEAIAPLEAEPVEIEGMLVAFDPYSAFMARLLGAVAAECPQVTLQLTEIAEFPILAGLRQVTRVPLLTIGGQRFEGLWEEVELVEQIVRIARGDPEPVIRERLLASPYLSDEQAQRLARERAAGRGGAGPGPRPPAPGPGGLIVPGR